MPVARAAPPSLCESCILPDCDESSRGCLLRSASYSVRTKQRLGLNDQITPDERAGANAFFHIWKDEADARRSELGGCDG